MATQVARNPFEEPPVGMPEASNFEVATVELPDPGPGEVLVRNAWMSVDPYMRGRMYDRPSYVPPFQIGPGAARRRGWHGGEVERSEVPAGRLGGEHEWLA